MKFTKMHGIGNDYIYINNIIEKLDINTMKEDIIKMSDRHKGIGSDGVIFIEASNVADAKMRMFNADGSEGKMCGNGIRCVGKYVYESGISKNNPLTIETLSGIKVLNLILDEEDIVKSVVVDMGEAILNSKDIPVSISEKSIINYPLIIKDNEYRITCVSMGNPHAVIFTSNIDSINLNDIGPYFENNEIFPEQVNTEFVEIIDDNTFKMRVYERGSGETMACGTGACATVVAAVLNGYAKKNREVKVILKGGNLFITYKDDNHVMMRGEAATVFTGVYSK